MTKQSGQSNILKTFISDGLQNAFFLHGIMDDETARIVCSLQELESERLKLLRRWIDELEGDNKTKAYEVNQVLPAFTQGYLSSPVLPGRALQTIREHGTAINFVPAAWNGERYAQADSAASMAQTTDINLALTAMSV